VIVQLLSSLDSVLTSPTSEHWLMTRKGLGCKFIELGLEIIASIKKYCVYEDGEVVDVQSQICCLFLCTSYFLGVLIM